MQLDFTNLLNSLNEVINIDYVMNADDFMYDTYKPLKNGVSIKGRAYQKVGVVYLELDVKFDFFGVCDRCMDDLEKNYEFSLSKIIVNKMENDNDDYDDYIVLDNNVLELDDLINEEIQLFLPAKMLCKEECKGLCQSCGKNLNYEKCECVKEVDPRLAVLSDLLID
ncbi:MAG TPA: nucleic acid-binding protein [Ruminococcaceae bacterium]|nr:nucleic acid-binding protein [Oscillospiraceae bacterium]